MIETIHRASYWKGAGEMQKTKSNKRKHLAKGRVYFDTLIDINYKLLKFDNAGFYDDILKSLACATNSCGSYFFEAADTSPKNSLTLRAGWNENTADVSEGARLELLSGQCLIRLSKGKTIHKKLSKLKKDEQSQFSAQNILSCVAVPVINDENYHGYIRFDSDSDEENYLAADVNFLKSAANLIAISIEYKNSYDRLQTSHYELRNLFYDKINQLEKLSKTIKNSRPEVQPESIPARQNSYFTQFFNNTREIVYITDLDGKFLSINSFVENITGFKREEIISKSVFEFIMPEYAPIYSKMLEMTRAGLLNHANYEIKFKTKSGETVFLEINNYAIGVSNEKPCEILGVARNVSEIRNTENKLRRLKADFYGVLDSSTDAIMSFKPVFDDKKKIIDFEWVLLNSAAEKLFDKKSAELVGRSMLDNLDNNSIESLFDRFVHTYENSIPLYYEHNYKYKDMNLWLRVSAVRHNDSLVMNLSDVTYQKQSEKELQQQLNFNEVLLDSLPYPALLLDKSRRILAFNQIAGNIGARYDEDCWKLFGHDETFRNKITHESSSCFFCNADTCLETGSSVRSFEHHQGSNYWQMNLLHVYDDIFLYFAIDTTETKKMLTQIEYADEKVRKSDSLKRQFLCNMSHELRTPMNIIIGFAELLSETTLEGEQSEFLRQIKTSSINLLTIINDIIDFSNIEAERLEINNAEFSLLELANEIVEKNAPGCAAKNLNLRLQFDPLINFNVISDAERLKQVLLNLLNNAIKFTEHGSINLNIALDTLRLSEDRALVKFEIIDEGIGIDEEKQKELFSPFIQADASLTRRYGGTGLGLTISNHLVRLLGSNKIFCESQPGKGSNFYFMIDFLKGRML